MAQTDADRTTGGGHDSPETGRSMPSGGALDALDGPPALCQILVASESTTNILVWSPKDNDNGADFVGLDSVEY